MDHGLPDQYTAKRGLVQPSSRGPDQQTGGFHVEAAGLLIWFSTNYQLVTPAGVCGATSLTTVSLRAIVVPTSPGVGMRVKGAKWQATQWSCTPVPTLRHSGTFCLQMSWASQQRVWKRQPVGGLSGLGTSPLS